MRYIFFFLLLLGSACLHAQEPKLMLPVGHTSGLWFAQFSSDGKIAVTAGDNTAKIWDVASGLLVADLKGHTGYVLFAQFSSDGRKIVTASVDNTAKVWDATSGAFLINLKGHTSYVWYAKFSPDGKKVVTASYDKTAKVWDGVSGLLLADLKGNTEAIKSAQFSPDGKKVVTACWDGTAKVWDATSGLLLVNFKGHNRSVNSACFSPDGKKIMTAASDSTAKIWNANSGLLLANLIGHIGSVNSANFSPDNRKVITASSDETAKIWDANSGLLLANLKGHIESVNSANFSPDNRKVVTASSDATAKVWDANSGLLLADLKGHTASIETAEFSPDNRKVVTASSDATAKVWDAVNGRLWADFKGHSNRFWSAGFMDNGKTVITTNTMAGTANIWDVTLGRLMINFKWHVEQNQTSRFSSDWKKIVTTGIDSVAEILEATSGKSLTKLKGYAGVVNSANFSPDGRKVVITYKDSISKIWDAVSGALLANLEGHTKAVNFAMFSPNGNKVLTISSDRTAKVWDAISGLLLTDLEDHTASIMSYSVVFSPDEKMIAAGTSDTSDDETVKVWDVETGKLLSNLRKHNWIISSIHFSADGKKIVTGSFDGTAKLWDIASQQIIVDFKGHKHWIETAEFSNDEKRLLTASRDNTAKIWDVASGELLITLNGHVQGLNSAQFSPDGKKVITSSRDNTCKLWNAETGELLYTFFAVDSTDYLVVDEYNRYDGTEGARKLLYFTCSTEVISLDQVKDQLWVPNLAERIMKGETINAPKLSDLNICGTLPIVEAAESRDSTIYRFAIMPQKSGLGETVLYVNDIEARRYTTGQLLRKNGGYELVVPQKELARFFKQGEANRVTIKAFTADNSISSRGVNVISETSKKATVVPHLYAVMVGVSDYKGTELDLRYAAKDATDLGKAVQAAAARWFGPDHVHLYNLTTDTGRTAFPEKATIRQILADIGKKAIPDDILLLFFAGHGVMGGKDKKQFYFLPADASNATATGAVAQVGISTGELANWMQPTFIKAQKRILILDACNSGQAINDLVTIGSAGQGYLASRSDEQAEQIKAIDKLNERSGLFVLAASASNQSAYEMSRYNQGLLTYALLKAMKQQPDILDDGRYLNVSRWFTAAEKTVTDLAKETGARQQPQIVTAGNFNIGLVDVEVMAKIALPCEKPVFTASNFQNEDKSVGGDDLELSTLLNRQLQDISTRGTANDLNFIPNSNMPDACSLQGSYEVNGSEITVHSNLWRTRKNAFAFVVKGSKDKLNDLVSAVIAKAEEWVNTIK